MGPWLRIGRRLELALTLFSTLSFLLFGLIFTRRAPTNIRWMVWIYVGGFCTAMLVFSLALVHSLRRRGIIAGAASTTTTHAPSKRIKIYVAALLVTIISATEQARVVAFRQRFSATTGDILFWNFVALAVLIAAVELLEWWNRRR